MPTRAVHRYQILQAVDMPREQEDDRISKYTPYELPLREDELVEIAMHVWEATGATMPDEGRAAFEEHNKNGVRSSIANAIGFDYYETLEENEDDADIVERDHGDAFLERELRHVREPLHWPERWVDQEYVGMVPPDVSNTVNGPARVSVTVDGEQLLDEEISLDEELDVDVEFERLGGDQR